MLVTTYLTSSPPHLLPRSPPKSPTHLLLNLLPKPSGGDLGGDLGGDWRRKVTLDPSIQLFKVFFLTRQQNVMI